MTTPKLIRDTSHGGPDEVSQASAPSPAARHSRMRRTPLYLTLCLLLGACASGPGQAPVAAAAPRCTEEMGYPACPEAGYYQGYPYFDGSYYPGTGVVLVPVPVPVPAPVPVPPKKPLPKPHKPVPPSKKRPDACHPT